MIPVLIFELCCIIVILKFVIILEFFTFEECDAATRSKGLYIMLEQVRDFRTPDETDDWLASNPMQCAGALHFRDRNATVISYGIQTNSTPLAKRGNFEDPTFKFQIPLQLAAEREIARSLVGGMTTATFIHLITSNMYTSFQS